MINDRKKILKKLRDPIYHIENIQGVTTIEDYQKVVIQAVATHERTVVAACHDVGKTWLASKVILWFTSVYQGAKVITTAPTFNQVKRLLWSEIRAGFTKSKHFLGGEMLTTEWKINEDWFAVGFTSRSEVTEGEGQGGASSFQGFHAPAILVVFDEATGIPGSIWKQMEGLMTSHFVRFLAIGNPTTKSCSFFQCFSSPSYHKIKLNCFDSPNFKANNINSMTELNTEILRLTELTQDEQYLELQKYKVTNLHLLTVKWVLQMILKWGIKHPLVLSKCLGEFPEEDEFTLMPMALIQDAQFRTYEPKEQDRVAIGVDVARFGADKTVIHVIHGRQVVMHKVMVKRDTNEICGELVRIIAAFKSMDIRMAIDATGLGAGLVDTLKEKRDVDKLIPQITEIREVYVGGSAAGAQSNDTAKDLSTKYVNLKARIFIQLAEDLKEILCLPEEDIYLEELPTIKYKFDSKGRWQIESKDEYKSRTGRTSPDDSDSLALANYARYDAAGVGNFTQSLIQRKNSSIIKHSGEAQWSRKNKKVLNLQKNLKVHLLPIVAERLRLRPLQMEHSDLLVQLPTPVIPPKNT